jgi:hypothetical protein
VRHGHELGKRWSTKDGVVSTLEVRDHEVDVVGAEVVGLPNCIWSVICLRGIELCLGRTPQNCAS